MKKLFVILTLVSVIKLSVADEGMWLLSMIQSLNLQSKGLNLSNEDIYAINKNCLKNSIIGLGNEGSPFRFFCTAEIVSDQGLVFTNHHCGLDLVQNHSSLGNNLLEEGFWAKTNAEELPNPGVTASYMILLKDVTDYIISNIPDTSSNKTRERFIDSLSNVLVASVEDTSDYEASVKSFYKGNRFYMFIYETFKDVRLVGAPPNSIGKYGGDTDNWMWPRHTGDFSVLRIYTGKDGKPASYSPDNIPYKPKYHLPISLKGYEKGDFAMIIGFPGDTERYQTSSWVADNMNIQNKEAITIRTMKLDLYKKYMDKDPKIKIQYATKWSHTSNYWKYFIGQNKGIVNLNVVNNKHNDEIELQKWIDSDESHKLKYGDVVSAINNYYDNSKPISKVKQYFIEGLFNTSDLLFLPYEYFQFRQMFYPEIDSIVLNNERKNINASLDDIFSEYNYELEKELLIKILELFHDNVEKEFYPDFFSEVDKKYKGNFELYINKIMSKSLFRDTTKIRNLFKSNNLKKLQSDFKLYDNDPLFSLMRSVIVSYYAIKDYIGSESDKLETNYRLFMAALLEKNDESTMYPDANSTPRLTYGYIGDYKARDAVFYDYYTTLKGVIEKEDPTNEEFYLDEKLKELYNKKDYGRYGKNGELNVCFISNNDITGGNSGSPVLNADGELIGIAFDGNWEAMSGDIIFENNIQKTISVDIRYVLFIIDKFAGATHLINELTIHE